MSETANHPTAGSSPSHAVTGGSNFSLEAALDHPLVAYAALPAGGALIGGATHPLAAALDRYLHHHESAHEWEQMRWRLRRLFAIGAGQVGRDDTHSPASAVAVSTDADC